MLLEWIADDPTVKSSKVSLFDGLIIMKCYKNGNGEWASLAIGAGETISFGESFQFELLAKRAAEKWLSQKLRSFKYVKRLKSTAGNRRKI